MFRLCWILATWTVAAGAIAVPGPLDGVHKPLETFIENYVRQEQRISPAGAYVRSSVKYGQLKSNPGWKAYIESLPYVDPSRLKTASRESRTAFWINTYNALAIDAVITNYPLGSSSFGPYAPGSLRGSSAWTMKHYVGGKEVTLDSIYEEIVGLNEPRALLAISQAAVSSPTILRAYNTHNLSLQLDDAVKAYINDPIVLRLDRGRRELHLGGLLSDIAPLLARSAVSTPPRVAGYPEKHRALIAFLLPYLTSDARNFITSRRINLKFLTFDWRLNEAQ